MANSDAPKPDRDTPGSPYGSQHGDVDEAAGGADSSPYETSPSGEKVDATGDESSTRRPSRDDPNRR